MVHQRVGNRTSFVTDGTDDDAAGPFDQQARIEAFVEVSLHVLQASVLSGVEPLGESFPVFGQCATAGDAAEIEPQFERVLLYEETVVHENNTDSNVRIIQNKVNFVVSGVCLPRDFVPK